MKNYISPSYTFTPGGAGSGTVKTGIKNFNIKFLIVILNITREEIIYAPGLSGRGYTAISSDTITLEYSTSGHSSTDILQFLYESTNDYPSIVDSSRNNDLLAQMQRLTKISESLQIVDSAQRQRIVIDSIAASLANANAIPVSQTTAANLNATVTQLTAANLNATVTQLTAANLLATVNIAASQTLATVTSVTNLASTAGMDREQYINIAKQTYASSIRSRLTIQ